MHYVLLGEKNYPKQNGGGKSNGQASVRRHHIRVHLLFLCLGYGLALCKVSSGHTVPVVTMSSDKERAIQRGDKRADPIGTASFVGSRLIDPLIQYQFLKHGWGNSLISRLRGRTLPQGPPLITRTPLDRLGLSPYRTVLLGMSVGSMLKQNYWVTAINQERMLPLFGLKVGVLNCVFNTLNTLFFMCAETSASTNGEHFPQSPLIFGCALYGLGLSIEWLSEQQRHSWKRNPANKGQVYTGGLWSLSRHINYFGYTLWRTGYAIAAGGWVWGAVTASLFSVTFLKASIPEHQEYMEEKVSCSKVQGWTSANRPTSTVRNSGNIRRRFPMLSYLSCARLDHSTDSTRRLSSRPNNVIPAL